MAAVGFSGAAAALNSAIYDGDFTFLACLVLILCICRVVLVSGGLKLFETRMTLLHLCPVDGGKRAVMFNRFPNPLSGEVSFH